MAKVLVTGGAGFIGSHLCERLVNQGDEVVILDDMSSGACENLAAIDDSVRLIEDSLLNIGSHADELTGVTRIYHLAALISGYDSLADPEPYIQANLTGVSRLIALASCLPGARIIFASSSTVYGNGTDEARTENTPAAPLSVYALTKYAGEHLLNMYGQMHGLNHVSLRLFNVYGPRQRPDHPYANVTCKFSHAAAVGGGVELFGDGRQSRDFVYVDDVVDALVAVSAGGRHRIYNVGTGIEHSIERLLQEVENAAGRRLEVRQRPAWPNDIRRIRADISRMAEEFGFRPRVSLAEGLRRTTDYFAGRPVPRVAVADMDLAASGT
jgi:UDP-glucose 4-epimerase